MSIEDDVHTMHSDRTRGAYEVWTANSVISTGWMTIMGAQTCLDSMELDWDTPLEIFYVRKILTRQERENPSLVRATQTRRWDSGGNLVPEQASSESSERREGQGLERDTGTRPPQMGRREAKRLLRYIRELEEELNKEISINDHLEK